MAAKSYSILLISKIYGQGLVEIYKLLYLLHKILNNYYETS